MNKVIKFLRLHQNTKISVRNNAHQGGETLGARYGEVVDAVAVGHLLTGGDVALRDEYHLLRGI